MDKVHPGEMLEELLRENSKSIEEFAKESQIGEDQIEDLIARKLSITTVIAERLEKATKIPAHLWLSLQSNYFKGVSEECNKKKTQTQRKK